MNKICVKIVICKRYGNIDDTVYFRHALTVEMVDRWRWYFEYLAALVKVHNPKQRVVLEMGVQDLLFEEEYIAKKTKDLLQHKKGEFNRLSNLKSKGQHDLFNFFEEKVDEKSQRLKKEIEELERGEFKYWVPQTYINKVKQYMKNKVK